ncbi:DUF885 domain-containing protein [Demequina sp.]|uniref:DUF885 domain-containing protein n=1 Tax=Demequina sp. TaxID=2050685 RepID=UPI003D0E69ED
MDTLTSLADEYYAFARAADGHSLLWNSSTEHLESWPAFSPDAVAEQQRQYSEFAARADALTATTPREVALKDAIAFTARSAAVDLTWNAAITGTHPALGFIGMIEVFGTRFNLVTGEHADQYLAKMRALPGALEDLASVAEAEALLGVVGLARHLDRTAANIEALLASPDALDRLAAQAPPSDLAEAQADTWVGELRQIVADEVIPALAGHAERMRALAERGRDDDHPGFCHLPGGDAQYRDLVWAMTSTDLTPEQIHQLGLDQIARLDEEYKQIAGPLVGTTDLAEIYRRFREDESLVYTNPEDLVRDAEEAFARANEALPRAFSRVPKTPCRVNAVKGGAQAYYSAPEPETGKPGEFFFNVLNPTDWSRTDVEGTTFHEGLPGHHLQFALHEEDTELHNVLKRMNVTAYLEGWALYTERLADELGLYSSELARVGMLLNDSLRACRLVVDTGMHAFGWTRQQAIDFMMDNSPNSLGAVTAEVDRYIAMPAQALSYMVGRLEIMRLREAAALPLPDFHERVLANGMVPLPTLSRLVLA